jgi:hypothetical protein
VTDATKDTLYTALRDYGFSVVVALAAGWVLRNDVLIPLVEEHRTFVRSLSETQSEISKAVTEQTKLLYEMKHMREQP